MDDRARIEELIVKHLDGIDVGTLAEEIERRVVQPARTSGGSATAGTFFAIIDKGDRPPCPVYEDKWFRTYQEANECRAAYPFPRELDIVSANYYAQATEREIERTSAPGSSADESEREYLRNPDYAGWVEELVEAARAVLKFDPTPDSDDDYQDALDRLRRSLPDDGSSAALVYDPELEAAYRCVSGNHVPELESLSQMTVCAKCKSDLVHEGGNWRTAPAVESSAGPWKCPKCGATVGSAETRCPLCASAPDASQDRYPTLRATRGVVGGDLCVGRTRIPVASLVALWTERGFKPGDIQALYPDLTRDEVEWALEYTRQRSAPSASPAVSPGRLARMRFDLAEPAEKWLVPSTATLGTKLQTMEAYLRELLDALADCGSTDVEER